MRKFSIYPAFFLLLFSCKTTQTAFTVDDIYVTPSEERQQERLAAIAKARADSAENDDYARQAANQRAADDNNPAYKDPAYSSGDYYDYQYSSRINRFYRPLAGAGYYDPYYTNYYSYNANPMMYGSSIYSGPSLNLYTGNVMYGGGFYGGGMPMYGGYSAGLSFGMYSPGYSYGYYDPFYNYYNPMMSPYGYGAYNPYYGMGYPGYNNFASYGYAPVYWGGGQNMYFNSLDQNSFRNAPRGSAGGGNAGYRPSGGNAPQQSERMNYINSQTGREQQRFNYSEQRPANTNNAGRMMDHSGSNDQYYQQDRRRNQGGERMQQSPNSRPSQQNPMNTGRSSGYGNGSFDNGGSRGGGGNGGGSAPRGGGGGGNSRRR